MNATAAEKPKVSRKKSKADKLTLRGWAEGAREDFILRPNLAKYIDAYQRGYLQERQCLANICNQYHVQISPDLSDDAEPDLPLPAYDPNIAYDLGAGLDDDAKTRLLARIGVLNAVRGRVSVGYVCD
ncbi:hypothetical protein BD626DRAFT_538444 [Schizophyllum amplum]|uniref:Uncharacterized protein n=1 Tax=Schizophyllum amplum TaxID=97359 RepID=A0A550C7W5_9AGAR|nr:hypothetical protein BD626DRAFT_538444 [Auriculariopsis ampla]